MRGFLSSLVVLCMGVTASSAQAQGPLQRTVQRALEEAVQASGMRAEVMRVETRLSPSCTVTRAEFPGVRGSGRLAVKLLGALPDGSACGDWAWVQYRVFIQAWVLTRPVREGELLAPAAVQQEREVTVGHAFVTELSPSSVAVRALPAATALEPRWVREPRTAPGTPVHVVVRVGDLEVEEVGHLSPCGQNKSCARLPSGKQVEGQLVDGRLLVEIP